MNPITQVFGTSIGKKYLMALTGLGLVAFVLIHMVGNLQIFLGPDAINAYAYKLHSLPPVVLWGFRAGLLLLIVVHVWTAIMLTRENRAARKVAGEIKPVQATYASRTMPITGFILLFFIIFHILQFTVRVVPEDYNATVPYVPTEIGYNTIEVFDVFTMMVAGFSSWWISAFYLLGMGLLCLHLTHGVSSMFQSLGFRNESTRYNLNRLALAYGWVIFLGFASIPAGVLVSTKGGPALVDMDHYNTIVEQVRSEMAHSEEDPDAGPIALHD